MLIEIYTKKDCPACARTKALLINHGYVFTEHEMGRDITREELLNRFPAAKFVPIITIDNEQVNPDEKSLLLLLENTARTI